MSACSLHNEEGCIRCAMKDNSSPTIHVYMIIDCSASMADRWEQTLSGLNEYISGLRIDSDTNNQPYKISVVSFDATSRSVYKEVELDALPKFDENTPELQPKGRSTSLYDACYNTIKAITTADPVLVVMITDGIENSSKIPSDALSTLMDERAKLGNYTWAYTAVDKAAWGNSAAIGMAVGQTANYVSGQEAVAFEGLKCATMSYSRSMRSNSVTGQAMNSSNFYSDANDAPLSSTLIPTATVVPDDDEPNP